MLGSACVRVCHGLERNRVTGPDITFQLMLPVCRPAQLQPQLGATVVVGCDALNASRSAVAARISSVRPVDGRITCSTMLDWAIGLRYPWPQRATHGVEVRSSRINFALLSSRRDTT
jgi:hypothetical protein